MDETPPLATIGLLRARCHVTEQVEIGSAQSAILRHVGDDVPGTTVAIQALERLPQVAAFLCPAACCQCRAPHIEPDSNAIAVLGNGAGAPGWVLERSSADVDASTTRRQRGCQRSVITNSRRSARHARRACPVTSASSSRLLPRPKAASRSTKWIHSAPPSCHANAAASGSPYDVSDPASP